MSDLSIPGLGSSKYGTDTLIAGLMKIERIPRDKAQARLESYQQQKTVWLELNQRISSLREEARGLYSFKNPFNERVATSSDEAVLTATATREAPQSTVKIEVKRAAAADRYLSADLGKDAQVSAGTYRFEVGEAGVELRYGGGSLKDFAEALNRKGRDILRASTVSVKPETQALVIESLRTGAANRLAFRGEAEDLAVKLGILERVSSRDRSLDPSSPQPWQAPLDKASVRYESGALGLATGGEARLALPSPAKTEGLVLELEYRLLRLPEAEASLRPPGPSIGATGSISYEGITISGAPSESGLPEWQAPPSPPRVEDRGMAFLLGPGGEPLPLPPLEDSAEKRKLSLPLEGLIPELGGLGFRNRDTGRRLELVSARLLDPKARDGLRAKRPVSTAADALVVVDGIEAERPKNEIADLVPGVTLSVKEASEKAVRLKIEPNREAVKESLIALVGTYNRLMAQVNILSRDDERLVQEISYFTDEEKKTATERLGLFQGDSTLSLIRSNLQRIMMEPYVTREGGELALLSQLGIATDARRPGAGQGFDVGRMRGYLEIEEDTLDAALAKNMDAVAELFGRDSDGDLIMDSGAAYALDSLLRPYVETGGILSLKTGTLDTQIGSEKRSIESLDRALASKESELKRKYGMMEGALNRMEGSSNSIDQFSKQNSGGQ